MKDNLLADEDLLLAVRPHWGSLVPAALVVVVGGGAWIWFGMVWGVPVVVAGLVLMLRASLARLSSHSLVTSRRVIVRSGLWRSQTIELEHKNIESFVIEQTPLGRLLNYGTVIVNGVGGARLPVESIARPGQFRRAALQAEEHLKLGSGAFGSTMLGVDMAALGREILLQVKLSPEQLNQTKALPDASMPGRGRVLEHDSQHEPHAEGQTPNDEK